MLTTSPSPLVVCSEDEFLIFDVLSAEVLHSCAIPGRIRRVSGADLDATGHVQAAFVWVDAQWGKILVRWGRRTLHFWNFGTRISQLDARRRPSEDRVMSVRLSKSEVARNLREDLCAYAEEEEEREQKRRLQKAFTLEGMNEEEMLQLAQILSLGDENFRQGTGPSHNGHLPNVRGNHNNGVDGIGDDDEEYQLQLAMSLSLSEMHK